MSKIHPLIHNAINLDGSIEKINKFYDDWAETYEVDLGEAYIAPKFIVNYLLEVLKSAQIPLDSLKIMDAGCGTGLIGKLLYEEGVRHIDGFDLSPEMVAVAARLNIYGTLRGEVDLSQALDDYPPNMYDVVICGGVFTFGHVPPQGLEQLVYLCRAGGIVILSTRTTYYDATDFQALSDQLIEAGRIELLQVIRDAPYTSDGYAHYWIYRCL